MDCVAQSRIVGYYSRALAFFKIQMRFERYVKGNVIKMSISLLLFCLLNLSSSSNTETKLCSVAASSQCQVPWVWRQTQHGLLVCEAPLALQLQHASWLVLQVQTIPCSCSFHSTFPPFQVDSGHAMCVVLQPIVLLSLPFHNPSLWWKQPDRWRITQGRQSQRESHTHTPIYSHENIEV